MTLAAVPDAVPVPDVLAGLVGGHDFDLAAHALAIADKLPPDGPQRVLASVRGSDNAWAALAGAKELLRAIVLADPCELAPVVALGLVVAATRLEVDRRRTNCNILGNGDGE